MAGDKRQLSRLTAAGMLAAAIQMASGSAGAYELYSSGDTKLDAKLTAGFGWFSSQESYFGRPGRSTWQEGYVKYGLVGQTGLGNSSVVYGGVSGLSSATWGDGDAGLNESGDERKSAWEDAYVGWKSGDLISALGKDGLDISAGRQQLVIGEGFIINNDQAQYGDVGLDGNDHFDRGGLYYLAARQSFAKTAIVRIGGTSGLRGDLAWVKSDNAGQSDTEFALANIEHISDAGTYGFMYLRGLDVNGDDFFASQRERDGMNLYNFRASTNAGIENFKLSGEYAIEDKDNAGTAGFVEAAYTFAAAPWTPTLNYRYSRFSKHYDPLFYGWGRGYGTWWQGEVAANYAGPFNTNTEVHHVGLLAKPRDNITLGALYFDFRTLDKKNFYDSSARELDLYVEWKPTEHYTITPLIGLYDPKSSGSGAAGEGTQTADSKLNTYTQLTFAVSF